MQSHSFEDVFRLRVMNFLGTGRDGMLFSISLYLIGNGLVNNTEYRMITGSFRRRKGTADLFV